jgi:hypothetical protein
MRLSNEVDQNFVRNAVPDGAEDLLAFLPSLGTAEAMVFGESVNMPMRVILSTLEEEYRPHSSSAKFSELWAVENTDPEFMAGVYNNWRSRNFSHDVDADNSKPVYAAQPVARPKAIAKPAPQPQKRVARTSGQDLRASLPSGNTGRAQSLADVKKMLNGAFNRDS